MLLFDDPQHFVLHPDLDRFGRVVPMNARGHASSELSEPFGEEPSHLSFRPLCRYPVAIQSPSNASRTE